jgi:hypothetical protein
MLVKNKKSGDIETLRHGPATDAVSAGTHEFVNVDEKGDVIEEKAKSSKPAANKAEVTK